MKPEALLKGYSLALDQLVEVLAIKADHDVVRAGCIQYFEFTFELAWKTIKAVAGQEGLGSAASPKAPTLPMRCTLQPVVLPPCTRLIAISARAPGRRESLRSCGFGIPTPVADMAKLFSPGRRTRQASAAEF
jgi:hypothetical protein